MNHEVEDADGAAWCILRSLFTHVVRWMIASPNASVEVMILHVGCISWCPMGRSRERRWWWCSRLGISLPLLTATLASVYVVSLAFVFGTETETRIFLSKQLLGLTMDEFIGLSLIDVENAVPARSVVNRIVIRKVRSVWFIKIMKSSCCFYVATSCHMHSSLADVLPGTHEWYSTTMWSQPRTIKDSERSRLYGEISERMDGPTRTASIVREYCGVKSSHWKIGRLSPYIVPGVSGVRESHHRLLSRLKGEGNRRRLTYAIDSDFQVVSVSITSSKGLFMEWRQGS